jgi:hypothetical protein
MDTHICQRNALQTIVICHYLTLEIRVVSKNKVEKQVYRVPIYFYPNEACKYFQWDLVLFLTWILYREGSLVVLSRDPPPSYPFLIGRTTDSEEMSGHECSRASPRTPLQGGPPVNLSIPLSYSVFQRAEQREARRRRGCQRRCGKRCEATTTGFRGEATTGVTAWRPIHHAIHGTWVPGTIASCPGIAGLEATAVGSSNDGTRGRGLRMITARAIRHACDYFVLVNRSSIFGSVPFLLDAGS